MGKERSIAFLDANRIPPVDLLRKGGMITAITMDLFLNSQMEKIVRLLSIATFVFVWEVV